jgi:hypothetical protein
MHKALCGDPSRRGSGEVKKKWKIYDFFYFSGFSFLKNFFYEVFVEQKI